MTPLSRASSGRERSAGRLSGWVFVLAGAVAVAHLAVAALGPYELHRDALLYLAMGEHLQLFRMDFPPFIALLARLERLFGDSETIIHIGPALAHGSLVALTAAFAFRLRAGTGTQLMAALVSATAPIFLRAGALYQPVIFDQLWWTAALYVLLRIGQESQRADAGPGFGGRVPPANRSEGGRWALIGLFLGLGLLTKFTILVLGLAILFALLATPLRRELRTPWPWAGAALAFLLGSPSIAGQVALDWPFFTQFQDLQSTQLERISAVAFVAEQVLLVGPIVLLGAAAAVWAVLRRTEPGTRAVAWAALAAFGILMVAGGKAYYAAPVWPALTGIGMAALARWTRRLRETGGRRGGGEPGAGTPWLATGVWTVVSILVVGWGLVVLPMGLPFLAPERMARYAARLGVTAAVTTNTGEQLELPQDFADMLGWKALAESVTAVYRSLPAEERESAVILATNYGRAGAIDFYGGADLPHAVAPVGSYWFWGPGDRPGQVTIVVGAEPEDLLERYFRSAALARRLENPWGVPEERNVAIVIARDPVRPLSQVWPEWRGVN